MEEKASNISSYLIRLVQKRIYISINIFLFYMYIYFYHKNSIEIYFYKNIFPQIFIDLAIRLKIPPNLPHQGSDCYDKISPETRWNIELSHTPMSKQLNNFRKQLEHKTKKQNSSTQQYKDVTISHFYNSVSSSPSKCYIFVQIL